MKEVQFTYEGALPASDKPWHIKSGAGHVWFVNEDHPPMALTDAGLVIVVDSAKNPEAPLIQPRSYE